VAGGVEEAAWKWAPVLLGSAASPLGPWPRAHIPPIPSDGAGLAALFSWPSSGLRVCCILMSPPRPAAHSADCSVVLAGSMLGGNCIILHDLLACRREGIDRQWPALKHSGYLPGSHGTRHVLSS